MKYKFDVFTSKAEAKTHLNVLFSDALSDISHQRQNILLLTAVITILISFTIITPVEGTYLGMKFNLTNIAAPRILGGIVCLYFLIIYSISVARDQQYRRRVIDDAVYRSTMVIGKNITESQKDADIGEDEKLDVFVDSTTSLKEAQELLNVHNHFVTLQLIFEILFPTLLAVYAIFISLIYPLYLLYMK